MSFLYFENELSTYLLMLRRSKTLRFVYPTDQQYFLLHETWNALVIVILSCIALLNSTRHETSWFILKVLVNWLIWNDWLLFCRLCRHPKSSPTRQRSRPIVVSQLERSNQNDQRNLLTFTLFQVLTPSCVTSFNIYLLKSVEDVSDVYKSV